MKKKTKRCAQCDCLLFHDFKQVHFQDIIMYMCKGCHSTHARENLVRKKTAKKSSIKKNRKKSTLDIKCESCGEKFKVNRGEQRWKKLCWTCYVRNREVLEELNMEMDRHCAPEGVE